MESKYPCPCLKCDREYCKKNGTSYKECAAWLTWFRWWWKRFHSVLTVTPQKIQPQADKFCYSHPDTVRRYLIAGPCKGCKAEKVCDVPCQNYLRWYDARMRIVRKKVGV